MALAIFRTDNIRVENAASFVRRYYPSNPVQPTDNQLYCMIGRETNPVGINPANGQAYGANAGAWSDDGLPPTPTDANSYDRQFWSMVIGGILVDPTNISLVVPRGPTTSWTQGTTYDLYDDTNPNLYNLNFYVMNQYNEVFVLVAKAPGATASLTEPVWYNTYNNAGTKSLIGVDTTYFNDGKQSIVTTAEGYTWKYIYTLTTHAVQNLLLDSWLPVNYGNLLWGTTSDPRYTQSQDSVTNTGSNGFAYKILGAHYALITATIQSGNSGSGLLPAGLEYRQMAFVENPFVAGSTNRATFAVGNNPSSVLPIPPAANQFAINTGSIIYLENQSPVYTQTDQQEVITVVAAF